MTNPAKLNLCAIGIVAAFALGAADAVWAAGSAAPAIEMASAGSAADQKLAASAMTMMDASTYQQTEARYQEGLSRERQGDLRAAFAAYRDAARAGHGLAQRRLGDIYGTGMGGIGRDYQSSLKWYARAHDQGIEIRNRPAVYSGLMR